jgi:hypothetical protein
VDADGTKVPRGKWYQPDEGVLPEILEEEKVEAGRRQVESVREKVKERMRGDEK